MTACWAMVPLVFVLMQGRAAISPINDGLGGYRDAGRWLTEQRCDVAKVVDVTGWSQFYSGRTGYTFEDLIAAPGDPYKISCIASGCHVGTPNSGPGSIKIALPSGNAGTYTPGQAMQLLVTIADATKAAYGFQMTARSGTASDLWVLWLSLLGHLVAKKPPEERIVKLITTR